MNKIFTLGILGVIAAAGAGCQVLSPVEDRVAYYVLEAGPLVERSATRLNGLRIAMEQPRMAGHLTGNELVLRTGRQELRFDAFHLWAQPLDDMVEDVLREHLLAQPGIQSVLVFPELLSEDVDFRLRVEIQRLAGTTDGQAILDARWTLRKGDGADPLVSSKSFRHSWTPGEIGSLVDAHSENLASLGEAIAADLKAQAGE